ncbi:hypothetical protein ACWDZ8_43830 [Streptomyces sp. NPDC003233]
MTSAADLATRFGPALDNGPESLRACAQDFGHIVQGTPLGILRPRSAAEIQTCWSTPDLGASR